MVIKVNESYWQKTAQKQVYPKINQNKKCDVVIIGGGLTGISLAYRLKDCGLKVIVLEEKEIGSQTSGHTTAKITFLHDLIYTYLNEYYSYHIAKKFFLSNKEAMNDIETIIEKEKIACDYYKNENVLYTFKKENVIKLKQEKELLESFGVKVKENVIKNALYSISIDNQAIFHPLKYLYALASLCRKDGIEIYENSQVKKVHRIKEEFLIDVNSYQVQCSDVVHATRYPFVYKGLYFMKVMAKREYVQYGICENQERRSLLCVDKKSISQRPVGNGLLEIGKNEVKNPIRWFAMDSETLRLIPYIGKLSKKRNEYIAFGYRKWGMSLSHVASKIIYDDLLEKENKYKALYENHYCSLSLIKKQLPLFMKDIKKGMIDNHFPPSKKLKNNEGAVMKIDGELIAVYKDNHGECHYMNPYCPHFKCIVQFNNKTKTWDCPCHGSTYDAYGKLINGPSLKNLNNK